jgi:hypothetical protein
LDFLPRIMPYADHAAPARDWPFPNAEDYVFFAAVKAK